MKVSTMENNNVAIIPARGGSKRVPGKNIRDFAGKPVIAYAIQNALDSKLFDEVIVSTDNNEIADIARQFGAKVPFMRSEKNADDFATTTDVLIEVLAKYEEMGRSYRYGCCLYPTTPLITTRRLVEGYEKMLEKAYDSLFPVLPFAYPIWRGMRLNNEKPQMIWPENLSCRSQDLETVYHDAGQFYWFDIEAFKAQRSLIMDNSGSLVLSENEVQDIDNESDWKMAELKYSYLYGR